jgi:hypothetical protein
MRRFLLLALVLAAVGGCGGESVFIAATSVMPTTTSTSTSTSTTSTTVAATTSTALEVSSTLPEGYSEPEIAYFVEIAGGAEFNPDVGVIHRWSDDVRITVYGDATAADLVMLDGIVDELNQLIVDGAVAVVSVGGNVEMHFAPQETFADIEPNYVPGNLGFVWVTWDSAGAIEYARVLIASDGVTQEERAHLIREEVTQSLGLLNDSWEYPDSIFYQGWTSGLEYAAIDRAVIEMMYRDDIRPGMGVDEAVAVLRGLNRLRPAA